MRGACHDWYHLMSQVPFIDLQAQYLAYKDEIDSAIARVVSSAGFVQGPEVAGLEDELAAYVGVRNAVTCASGTDALYIALRAVGIGSGDEVITTGFSFFATAATIVQIGATPVFADIDSRTCNVDPARVEAAITPATKAILPVGLYGQPARMDEIASIAARHRLIVIEDAAQSFGGALGERRSGALGTIGCTSFYPAKPLGAYGEGGALFTDDDVLAQKARQIMNQGQRAGYDHVSFGVNGRMHALQAAVLRVKLAHFPGEMDRRQELAARYTDALRGVEGVGLPYVPDGTTSAWAQYTIRTAHRDELRAWLSGRGVPTAIHYPRPMYRQDAFSEYGDEWVNATGEACPECERAAAEVVSLPFGPFLAERDQDRVVEAIASFGGG